MELTKELILAVKRNNSHGGYGLQKECEALVGHVLLNMIKSNLPKLNRDVKNDEDCVVYREEGNQCFVLGDDDEAVEKYTMSLAYATDKVSMALAFANRSAALYRKQLYKECLIDIDAALAYGYPEEKKNKLKERAIKAVNSLQQLYQIKDLNMNDLPLVDNLPTSYEENKLKNKISLPMVKELVENEIQSKESCDGLENLMSQNTNTASKYTIKTHELCFVHGPSDEVSALDKGVEIAFSEKYGRHLIAKESFEAGDILVIENPYAYVLYREKYYTHCHHCLARSYNLIPCTECPVVVYCSEICKNASWEMSHRIECSIYAVLVKLMNKNEDKMRIFTKIMRLLTISTKNGTFIDELRKDLQEAEKNPNNRTAGFTDNGTFNSSSARSAMSLATNLAVRPVMEVSAFACTAALTTVLLAMESDFFGKKYNPEELKNIINQDDLRFCGMLLFRNCVIISSNSFSIQQDPGVKAGSGLYIAGSLMNHSCAPNTFRHFDGLTMITRALEPIKKGDQIFTGYGRGYQFVSRAERRSKMMEEYFFNCDCPACIEDWPMYSEILRDHIGSIAKTKKELVEKLKPYRKRLYENKYDIDAVKKVISLLYEEVKMPCEEIVHAIQYLKCYYLDL